MAQRKGWFEIAGVQTGDRKVEEQLRGLEDALEQAKGKRVLDLGCAEGCISIEFARAGAAAVVAYDYNVPFIELAQEMAFKLPREVAAVLSFTQRDIRKLLEAGPSARFDIVLALGIAHKLPDPGEVLRYAARSCSDLLLLRSKPETDQGVIRAKQAPHRIVNGFQILQAEGFQLEQVRKSARGEAAQYWRRAA